MTLGPTIEQKAAAFVALHQADTFIIPNPWDAGSARLLETLGFKALATTSSGFAFTLGRRDGETSLPEVAEHVRQLNEAATVPISVDLENGYGPDPEHAAEAITRVATAGAVGGSIEDYDSESGMYNVDRAVERVTAAAEAAQQLTFSFTLTARAENDIKSLADLDDAIARLQAYEGAGADVLYAPGLRTLDEIRAVCASVAKPVNVLARPGLTTQEIAAAGARRISVGGALTWVAMRALSDAAAKLRDEGDLSVLNAPSPTDEWPDR